MLYIDFHTHHVPLRKDVLAVVDGRDTWGIHPWEAALSSVPSTRGEGTIKSFPLGEDSGEAPSVDFGEVLAIGECGLDALRGPSLEVQEEVFLRHVALSEQTAKPLIIHCVKALDELLRLRRQAQPTMPWMHHGFRGKPQQLRSLLDAGFYVSFGFNHNDESLRLCPPDRLLLETDDDQTHSIVEIYNNVARKRALDVEDLVTLMKKNYRAFFQKEPLLT